MTTLTDKTNIKNFNAIFKDDQLAKGNSYN